MTVLHWPKLFEGWMLTSKYRHSGDGDLTGDGLGGGYIGSAITRRGDGRGDGSGSGTSPWYGNGDGDGNGGGGYGRGSGSGDGYDNGGGNGSAKKSV